MHGTMRRYIKLSKYLCFSGWFFGGRRVFYVKIEDVTYTQTFPRKRIFRFWELRNIKNHRNLAVEKFHRFQPFSLRKQNGFWRWTLGVVFTSLYLFLFSFSIFILYLYLPFPCKFLKTNSWLHSVSNSFLIKKMY